MSESDSDLEPHDPPTDDFPSEPESLTDEEIDSSLEVDEIVESVAYHGTDFDVEGLVRRLDRRDIVIPQIGTYDDQVELASFQRKFVWTGKQMDRFIESLLLGFPIPGIMLVQQSDKRYLVLDGQQRLTTLQAFYPSVNDPNRQFKLENVSSEFKNLTYKSLPDTLRRKLDNTFIQATIVRADESDASREAVYQIFERLNSGGTQLTPHEIRLALYPGRLVNFIGEINNSSEWRKVYGAVSPRLRDHEVLLRTIALYTATEFYVRPMKRFLNDFLGRNKDNAAVASDDIQTRLLESISAIAESSSLAYLRPPRQRLNVPRFDAIAIGAMRFFETTGSISSADVDRAINTLRTDTEFDTASSKQPDIDENVKSRIRIATRAFMQ